MTFRKFLSFTVIFVVVFFVSYAAHADGGINILIFGNPADDVDICTSYEGIFLPVQKVSQVLGYDDFNFNKENFSKDSFKEKDGCLFASLRTISKIFGCNVLYSAKIKTVSITKGKCCVIHFLDCGQADCTFIELPDGKCMLIDSGTADFSEKLISRIKSLGYSHIDYVVATHPHSDHIGSMPEILRTFSAGSFFMPGVSHNSDNFENMLDALSENGCKRYIASRGMTLFDNRASCTALAPIKTDYERINDFSVVLKLNYKDISALFSADAEAFSELEMIQSKQNLDSDILKVGHHGSNSSSTEDYISAVTPDASVIFAGKNNKYGFPSKKVLKRLESCGSDIFRTDISGDIEIVTDGFIYVVTAD